jgi:hypothetical protein
MHDMKTGSKVKLVGVTDRDDKQIFGKIIEYNQDGLCIVETKDKVVAILSSQLISVKDS